MFLLHILKRADHSGTLYVPEITGQWGGQPAGVRSAPRADGSRWDSSRARSVTILECAPPSLPWGGRCRGHGGGKGGSKGLSEIILETHFSCDEGWPLESEQQRVARLRGPAAPGARRRRLGWVWAGCWWAGLHVLPDSGPALEFRDS